MEINVDFFKLEYNGVSPKQGSILISEPFSPDGYFKRSIILLAEHNDNGTIGFILNKTVNIKVSEIIKNETPFNTLVNLGGPVNKNRIYYIHSLPNLIPGSTSITNTIYWGGSFETVKNLIKTNAIQPEQIRFFIGYAGWQPKQLMREIKKDYWLVSDLDSFSIMNKSVDLWEYKLQQMGAHYSTWANFPENPIYN